MKMMRLAMLLAVALMTAVRADEPEMLTRTYSIMPTVLVAVERGNVRTPEEYEAGTRRVLIDEGVTFPDGSVLLLADENQVLVMRNTPENHRLVEDILIRIDCVPMAVEIDLSLIVFELKFVEQQARQSGSISLTGERVLALYRDGHGRLITTGKVVTRSGVNAQTQGVDEVIYPTSFVRTTAKTDDAAEKVEIVPDAFETRETGLILNITPTVGPDKRTIDITLVPELAELQGWDDVDVTVVGPGKEEVRRRVRQPRFFSRNVTTSIVLTDGETVVMGAMPNRELTEITYMLVTARLIDARGRPIRPAPEGKATPPAEP
jgi:type II secretory pathway component GspD/PulD (secretin)